MASAQNVVVTGVSTGIGKGTTKVLISKGFRVFGSVRKQADADRLQGELGEGFVPVLMVSPMVVIQSFAPLLGTDKKRQGPPGRIVNITSSGAKVPIPLLGAYSASKAGLEGFSDVLRLELRLFGIHLVMIEPGFVNTAMYDKGEQEDLSEFKSTEYWGPVQNFRKYTIAEGRKGLSPEHLGQAVYVALTTPKPRARYAVIKQRFKNWTLPRLLPAKMLDGVMAKQLGLNRPAD